MEKRLENLYEMMTKSLISKQTWTNLISKSSNMAATEGSFLFDGCLYTGYENQSECLYFFQS